MTTFPSRPHLRPTLSPPRSGLVLALCLGLLGLMQPTTASAAETNAAWDTFSDTWVATDSLGRSLPTSTEAGPPKPNRHVGIFYFLWLTGKGPVYDLTHILAANSNNPAYGPPSAFHFWSEPLLGYYRSDDEFVIRKHAQMLADAGVDVLFFDVTNAYTYDPVYRRICAVLSAMRASGLRTPQIAFLAHSSEGQVVQRLYDDFYRPGTHADLWLRWLGKPLVLAAPKALTPALNDFFTVRESWAWTKGHPWFGDGQDKWPWLDNHPQTPGWHERPAKPEQLSVCVAQHPTSNIGRSFHDGQQPPPAQWDSARGFCFAEQWQRALQVNPEFLFLTGWNEWIAQRFISERGGQTMLGQRLPPGGTFFVDQYSQEYSRDIEAMRGGHGDNYTYQMIGGIRRYKGARAIPPLTAGAIVVDGRFEDWRTVGPEFRDTLGDPVQRDHPGWEGQPRFVNHSGRNDLAVAKVSTDTTNLYFYIRTREPLTPPTDTNWMSLFIDADHNPKTGWLGYDYVVNRSNVRPGLTTLERNEGGTYQWRSPVDVTYRVADNELELAIPRTALGLTPGPFTLDFKWADNLPLTGDWSDFTLHGDAAPNDRFNYRAILQPSAAPEAGR